jgi:hypothetical protein
VTTFTSARVLADSVAHGNLFARHSRITTLEVTFPRFILAEFNTHRMLSRNSASSRAIPPEKQLARIRDDDYFVPTFGSRVKGMGQGDDLSHAQQRLLRLEWREAALRAAGLDLLDGQGAFVDDRHRSHAVIFGALAAADRIARGTAARAVLGVAYVVAAILQAVSSLVERVARDRVRQVTLLAEGKTVLVLIGARTDELGVLGRRRAERILFAASAHSDGGHEHGNQSDRFKSHFSP